jgi:radical SAM superfamily enzyme YgiQ (UPF0313 family)
MQILMVAANTERINLPTLPLGAALVAAAARGAGHEVAFLDLMFEPDPGEALRRAIRSVQPELIGVSVRNIDDQEMARPTFLLDKVRPVIAACRQVSAAPVVLGGAGYTIFPAATLEYLGADYGICGEGEAAFPALLAALEGAGNPARVPGVHSPGHPPREPRATVDPLDGLLPVGDELWASFDLADPDLWVPVQTRRGCPYRCSYCSTPSIEGHRMRTRSPRLVAAELRRMADAGVRQIQFVDNIFNIPREYAVELCREIAALDTHLAWQCILYPRGVDQELAAAMARAGCTTVSLGFEAGNDPMLRAYDKRFDTAEVRRISDLLVAHGIRRFGFLLLGGPGETRDTVTKSLDFVESLGLDMLRVTIGIRIYPGTPLAATAVSEGVIAPDDDLLRPRFYMAPGLEEFIRQEVAARALGGPPTSGSVPSSAAGR